MTPRKRKSEGKAVLADRPHTVVAEIDLEESRPRKPDWAELSDLVSGARKRGFSDDQMEYFTSVVGLTWAKAYNRGRADFMREQLEANE